MIELKSQHLYIFRYCFTLHSYNTVNFYRVRHRVVSAHSFLIDFLSLKHTKEHCRCRIPKFPTGESHCRWDQSRARNTFQLNIEHSRLGPTLLWRFHFLSQRIFSSVYIKLSNKWILQNYTDERNCEFTTVYLYNTNITQQFHESKCN